MVPHPMVSLSIIFFVGFMKNIVVFLCFKSMISIFIMKNKFPVYLIFQFIQTDTNYGHITSHSMLAKKHKQNKSHPKKYVDENVDGFHQATEKKSIYDKKYFDYLPVEQKGASEPTYEAGFVKRTNSRRLRRDTEGVVEQPRTKRQS